MLLQKVSAITSRKSLRTNRIQSFACAVLMVLFAAGLCQAAGATTQLVCMTGALPMGSKTSPPDIVVASGTCTVGPGAYYFHNINIILGGGQLHFNDAVTEFWAESILIQNGGSLTAGTTSAPIGTAGGHITIHLWAPIDRSGR